MSKRLAIVALLAGLTAACAQQQPDVVTTAPVTVEPVYQGKF